MGISLEAVNELEDAIDRKIQQAAAKQTRAYGEVSRIESDGTVYVLLDGAESDTPASANAAAVKEGERVSVTVDGGQMVIDGNYSAPATDDTAARAAQATANSALQSADVAATAAAEAQSSAAVAAGAAEDAVEAAEAAQDSLKSVVQGATTVEKAVSVMQTALESIIDYDPNTTAETFTGDGSTTDVVLRTEATDVLSATIDGEAVEYTSSVVGGVTVVSLAEVPAEDSRIVITYEHATTQEWFWHDANGAHVLGDTSGYRNDINSSGMDIKQVSDERSVAQFGADGARIGRDYDAQASDNESHIELDYHSMQFIDKEGNTYFHVSDLRDRAGEAEIVDTYSGDGTHTWFNLGIDAVDTNYSVKVDGTEVTSGITKTTTQFGFNTAPADGAEIVATYNTSSEKAKAFTFGSRGTGNIGPLSTVVGVDAVASGYGSYAEGYRSIANGRFSHAEGMDSYAGGWNSHAEGKDTVATATESHAEGNGTQATSSEAHAEGLGTHATGYCTHSEGRYTVASGHYSHAEGDGSKSQGEASHAEGDDTIASASASHAEGRETTANDICSHAEGYKSVAYYAYSHAQNIGTIAKGHAQTAIGRYNVEDTGNYLVQDRFVGDGDTRRYVLSRYTRSYATGKIDGVQVETTVSYGDAAVTVTLARTPNVGSEVVISYYAHDTYALIIGNGTADNDRTNALTVAWNGNVEAAGEITMQSLDADRDGTPPSENATRYIYVTDKDGEYIGLIGTVMRPTSGRVDSILAAYNEADGEMKRNAIYVCMARDGTRSYVVDDPAAFRDALGATDGVWAASQIPTLPTSKIDGLGNAVNGTSITNAVPNNTYKSVRSVSLAAGTWILVGGCYYPANSTGQRWAIISSDDGALPAAATVALGASRVQACSSGATVVHTSSIVFPSATTTYYLQAHQNSGSSLTLTGAYLRAVRIK